MANTGSLFISHLKKEKLLSLSNILIMTVTFTFLGIFILTVVYSQTALRYLEQQAQVTIFFKDEVSPEKILAYSDQLKQDSRIEEAKYISKEAALQIFKEMNKNEPILLESVTAKVLPASIEVKAKDISQLKIISEDLKKFEGVEEVRFFEDVVQKFSVWSHVVYIISFVLALILIIISYSIVTATIRTSINSRGTELEIMKLVGASDNYVKKPFIYQGEFYGTVAAFIGSLIMFLINAAIQKINLFPKGLAIGFLSGVYISPIIFSLILAVILILSGFLLGLVGSSSAIKKYLKY